MGEHVYTWVYVGIHGYTCMSEHGFTNGSPESAKIRERENCTHRFMLGDGPKVFVCRRLITHSVHSGSNT